MSLSLIEYLFGRNKKINQQILICLNVFFYSPFVWSIADADDLLQPFVNESAMYNDNVYSQPSNAKLGNGTQKDDFINRASIGTAIHKTFGQQTFNASLQADDNSYAANKILSHVSTADSATLNWLLSDNLSGTLGAQYSRALSGFANTQYLSPDMLETPAYYFDTSYKVNSNWHLDAGWRMTDTLHGAVSRQTQNTESQNFYGGATYITAQGNSLGTKYQLTDAKFPRRVLNVSALSDTAYQENTLKMLLKYNYSPKIQLDGEAGYMSRTNPNISKMNFQGQVWRVNMNWVPTVKALVTVSGWHELASFTELASNYYVSEGFSLSPQWAVNEKFILSGQVKVESQSHVSNAQVVSNTTPLRMDNLLSGQISGSYSLNAIAKFTLGYQFSERNSNRESYSYTGDIVNAGAQIKF